MSPELNFLKFQNPSQGELLLAEVVSAVVDFMKLAPTARYRVMIGSDSNGHGSLDLVSVVAVHRVGNGGRYFWCRMTKNNIKTLRQKIYAEVEASLSLASSFLPAFKDALSHESDRLELPFDFEIHVDVGLVGETRDLVHEVTGMVRGYGYEVLIKPESAAATSVADRHVR
ncbi:MAG: ribonuclease H-like YkuK family protein [bacterium]|nr:ribonuclease H-like YkuK family protein [bacterium]